MTVWVGHLNEYIIINEMIYIYGSDEQFIAIKPCIFLSEIQKDLLKYILKNTIHIFFFGGGGEGKRISEEKRGERISVMQSLQGQAVLSKTGEKEKAFVFALFKA